MLEKIVFFGATRLKLPGKIIRELRNISRAASNFSALFSQKEENL